MIETPPARHAGGMPNARIHRTWGGPMTTTTPARPVACRYPPAAAHGRPLHCATTNQPTLTSSQRVKWIAGQVTKHGITMR